MRHDHAFTHYDWNTGNYDLTDEQEDELDERIREEITSEPSEGHMDFEIYDVAEDDDGDFITANVDAYTNYGEGRFYGFDAETASNDEYLREKEKVAGLDKEERYELYDSDKLDCDECGAVNETVGYVEEGYKLCEPCDREMMAKQGYEAETFDAERISKPKEDILKEKCGLCGDTLILVDNGLGLKYKTCLGEYCGYILPMNAETESNCPVCKGEVYGDMSMIGEETVADICGDCDIYIMPQGISCIECGFGDPYGSATSCESCEPIAEKMKMVNKNAETVGNQEELKCDVCETNEKLFELTDTAYWSVLCGQCIKDGEESHWLIKTHIPETFPAGSKGRTTPKTEVGYRFSDAETVGSPSPSSPLEEVPATVPSPAEPTNESFNAESGQMCEVCFGNDDLPYDFDHFTECRRCGKSVCLDCWGEMQSHPDWFKVCGECSDVLDNVHDYGAESKNTKMVLGVTALGIGLAFWKGKDLLSLWDRIKEKME